MIFRLMFEKLYISRPSILFGNFILYLRVKLGKTLLKKLWDFGHQTPIALSLSLSSLGFQIGIALFACVGFNLPPSFPPLLSLVWLPCPLPARPRSLVLSAL